MRHLSYFMLDVWATRIKLMGFASTYAQRKRRYLVGRFQVFICDQERALKVRRLAEICLSHFLQLSCSLLKNNPSETILIWP